MKEERAYNDSQISSLRNLWLVGTMEENQIYEEICSDWGIVSKTKVSS